MHALIASQVTTPGVKKIKTPPPYILDFEIAKN